MGLNLVVFLVVIILFSICTSPSFQQLQSSQTEILFQLRNHLEYPKQLDAWNNKKDLCGVPKSSALSIKCEDGSVKELKIVGDRLVNVTQFEGYSIPGQTLSQDFSVDSLITTLTRLTSLRVVILVSLGIWGPLSDKIHRLYSLEVLDLSSNFLYGSIPPKISAMGVLQTLTFDGNFFNDTVPDWFDSLSNLKVLSLKGNMLKGSLPRSLGGVRTLTSLALSSNNISGHLPDLSGLDHLQLLDLRENKLESELPILPKSLVTILLSRNSLSGEIPVQFGELHQLQHLDMSFNLLHGLPPASLLSLPNITYLNLQSNMLSGVLPRDLSCSSRLGFVDISANRLMGDLPSCLSTVSNKRVVKFSGNCLVIDPKHQHEASYCKSVAMNTRSSKGKGIGVLIGVIGGMVIFVLLSLLIFVILIRRKCYRPSAEKHLLQTPAKANSPAGLATELLSNARFVSQTKKLGTPVLPRYRVFSLEELQEATNNFDHSTSISEGSFGKIYRGRLENGTYAAIKCLPFFKKDSIRNLNLRLDLLSKLRHPHLVCLLGHCIDNSSDNSNINRVFLVYEYLQNGNLRTHLSETQLGRVLNWPDRLAILIGIAKAVHFLHTGTIPGFFNNRLKTSNILLDEHCIAKLSNYGLSIITEEIERHESREDEQKSSYAIQSKSSSRGTTNLEDDVYMFGFVLLETLAGPWIVERGEAYCLTEMAKLSNQEDRKRMLDPAVLNTSSQESLSIIISITNKCLSPDSSFRPSIEDVLWNLHYAAQVHVVPDADQKSDVTGQSM